MTTGLKRFVSSLLACSVSAGFHFSYFFRGCASLNIHGGKVMIICLLLKQAHILEDVDLFRLRQSKKRWRVLVWMRWLYCLRRSLIYTFNKQHLLPEGQTAEKTQFLTFPPLSLREMMSLCSFISSSPMMAIDPGQGEQGEIDWETLAWSKRKDSHWAFWLGCRFQMELPLHQGPLTISPPLSNIILWTHTYVSALLRVSG